MFHRLHLACFVPLQQTGSGSSSLPASRLTNAGGKRGEARSRRSLSATCTASATASARRCCGCRCCWKGAAPIGQFHVSVLSPTTVPNKNLCCTRPCASTCAVRFRWAPRQQQADAYTQLCGAVRRGGGAAAQAAEEAASGFSDAEAARQAEARALASAELLRRENRSTWTMLDERQQAIQRLEVCRECLHGNFFMIESHLQRLGMFLMHSEMGATMGTH